MKRTSIPEYYRGKTILITGASGFIGKVLIWKLLKSCSHLDTIYILVRPKYGKDVQVRVSELFQAPIFENFKKENPQLLSKVQAIAGDISEERLGLSEADERILINSVNVVFHIAAILKFEASLRDAVTLNVKGTQELLELATKMTNLEAFIHTSTAYCHCDKDELGEETYATYESPHQMMELVHWMKPETLDDICKDLIKPHPNTYTYSKRLAENIVSEYHPKLPIAIARPSVVIPSFLEPFPGWVDNVNGVTGFMIAGGKGAMRVAWCDKDNFLDTIPVDIVCNGLIAVAWQISQMTERSESIPVYNLVDRDVEKITFDKISSDSNIVKEIYPFSVCLWYPDLIFTDNFYIYSVIAFFLHWIPAYLIDMILFVLGYKTFMIRVQRKIHHGTILFHYFMSRKWRFVSNNIPKLQEKMSDEDRGTFRLTNAGINRLEYLKQCAIWARQYIVKDDPSTLPLARRRFKRLYWMHVFVRTIFWIFVASVCLRLVSYVGGIIVQV